MMWSLFKKLIHGIKLRTYVTLSSQQFLSSHVLSTLAPKLELGSVSSIFTPEQLLSVGLVLAFYQVRKFSSSDCTVRRLYTAANAY